MGFGVVIKTETHFADVEIRINRNKIYLFKSWSARLDSEPYDRRVFEYYLQRDINSTFSVWRVVKRQKTKIPEEYM